MAEKMELRIVTPSGPFYSGEVSMVELTTTEGGMGIYPEHVATTAIIAPGVLKIHEDSEVKTAALHKGFVEILPHRIMIIAESIEWPWEIDAKRAEEARIRAERRLSERGSSYNRLRAELALRRALLRLQMTKK